MISLNLNKTFLSTYLFVLLALLNSSSTFFFWCLLECNMVTFILLCFFCGNYAFKVETFDLAFFYFIVQSVGSVILLISLAWVLTFNSNLPSDAAMLAIFFKLGIFPFYSWALSSIEFFSSFSLPLLLTLQKIPLLVFVFGLPSLTLIPLILISSGLGSAFLLICGSWPKVLLFSSIYSTFWVYGIFSMGLSLFLKFFFIYTMFVFIFSFYFFFKRSESFSDFLVYWGALLFFVGLPPLSMFFFKVWFVQWVYLNFSPFIFVTLWLFIFLSLLGYFKFLYSGLFTGPKIYPSPTLNYLSSYLALALASLSLMIA